MEENICVSKCSVGSGEPGRLLCRMWSSVETEGKWRKESVRLQSLKLERGLEMQRKRKAWGCCCRRHRSPAESQRNIPWETAKALGNDQELIPEHTGPEDPPLKGKILKPSCRHSQTGQLQTPSSPMVLSIKPEPSLFLCFFLITITDLAEGGLHPPLLGSSFPISIRRRGSSSESGSVEEDGSSSRWSW